MISELLLSMPAGTEWLIVLIVLAIAISFLGFWIYTIVDIVKSKFQDETTKIIWVLVVVLLGLLGSILYWIFGRSGRVLAEQNNI